MKEENKNIIYFALSKEEKARTKKRLDQYASNYHYQLPIKLKKY